MKYKFRTKPYAHQLAALEKSWNKKEYGYFMEMGTGKTKVLIDNMSMLYDKGKIDGALIVAPKGVYTNWLSQEIPIHLVKHIKPKMVLWTATSSKKKEQEYAVAKQRKADQLASDKKRVKGTVRRVVKNIVAPALLASAYEVSGRKKKK